MGSSSSQVINYLLTIILIVMFIRTFRQSRQLKSNKGFSEAYSKVLADDLDAVESLDKYIETEKNPDLLSQAYLLKAYMALEKGTDVKEFLDKVDVKAVFSNAKGVFDSRIVINNISFFLWVNMFIARCLKYNQIQYIDELNDKFKDLDDKLNDFLEYRLYKGIYAVVKKDKNEYYDFLKQLISGEYPTLKYEKRYIGLSKREATIFLVYAGESVDEYWLEDLHAFVDTTVGKRISTDLDMYDKYHVEQETEPIAADEEEEKK